MRLEEARSRVVVETKATAKLLQHLLREIRACQTTGHPEHKKCVALQVLRPQLFLAVAASATWRLFTVDDREGRAVLGDELPDLEALRFSASVSVTGSLVTQTRSGSRVGATCTAAATGIPDGRPSGATAEPGSPLSEAQSQSGDGG
jgi:hypothetical protein